LDKRVRSDHPLRRIDETLELDFVRREVAQFYGTKGTSNRTEAAEKLGISRRALQYKIKRYGLVGFNKSHRR
jgi:DNA-binding NtrC family response regulator